MNVLMTAVCLKWLMKALLIPWLLLVGSPIPLEKIVNQNLTVRQQPLQRPRQLFVS